MGIGSSGRRRQGLLMPLRALPALVFWGGYRWWYGAPLMMVNAR